MSSLLAITAPSFSQFHIDKAGNKVEFLGRISAHEHERGRKILFTLKDNIFNNSPKTYKIQLHNHSLYRTAQKQILLNFSDSECF